MQRLILAVLGAAALGAISVAGRKFYRSTKLRPGKEDIARREGEGGSPVPNPNQKA